MSFSADSCSYTINLNWNPISYSSPSTFSLPTAIEDAWRRELYKSIHHNIFVEIFKRTHADFFGTQHICFYDYSGADGSCANFELKYRLNEDTVRAWSVNEVQDFMEILNTARIWIGFEKSIDGVDAGTEEETFKTFEKASLLADPRSPRSPIFATFSDSSIETQVGTVTEEDRFARGSFSDSLTTRNGSFSKSSLTRRSSFERLFSCSKHQGIVPASLNSPIVFPVTNTSPISPATNPTPRNARRRRLSSYSRRSVFMEEEQLTFRIPPPFLLVLYLAQFLVIGIAAGIVYFEIPALVSNTASSVLESVGGIMHLHPMLSGAVVGAYALDWVFAQLVGSVFRRKNKE